MRPPESTRTRSSGPTVGLKLNCGLPLPTFSEALTSVSVLPVTIGCGGSTDCPCGGSRAASPNSAGLAALCGIDAATISVPAIFAVAASVMPAAALLRVGPLTVLFAEDFDAAAVEGEADFFFGATLLRAGILSRFGESRFPEQPLCPLRPNLKKCDRAHRGKGAVRDGERGCSARPERAR